MMTMPAKLREYRYHLIVAMVFSAVVGFIAYAAPRILNILAYFWPLFASTAVIFAMGMTFGGVQQLSGEGHGEKTGEGLMAYVAGRAHYHDETHKYE